MWYRVTCWTAIFVDERERGAGYVVGASGGEAFGNSFHQRRFPGSEVTTEQDDKWRGQLGGEAPPQGDGFVGRVGDDFARRGPVGHPEDSIATRVTRGWSQGLPVD